MHWNGDITNIENAIQDYAKVCKEIGKIDEQIEKYSSEYDVMHNLLGEDVDALLYTIKRLKDKRAGLENSKSFSESIIYKSFDHYYA